MKDAMLDEDFLRALDKYPHQFVWGKIVALDFEENPIEEIQGRITNGTISIDGSSAVRRTCSLTLVGAELNINDYNWGLKTKFKVFVGLENHINSDYEDIIWFKQGIFLVSSFSCSLATNSYSVSIQGKDKMCMLNGEIGGVIPASWDFATEDVTDEDGNTTNEQIAIKNIILEAVHEFAQEPWQNIIVNDLDDYGIELLEYTGDKPLYYIITADASGDNSREVYQMTLNGDMACSVLKAELSGETVITTDVEIPNQTLAGLNSGNFTAQTVDGATINLNEDSDINYCYEKLIEELDPSGNVTETPEYYRTRIKLDGDDNVYTVAKITATNGLKVCGYRICDIVYPYDLIVSPGGVITSDVLDKLVSMLGNYEYFYDVDGRFVFQKKKTYSDVSYNNIINEHAINSEVWANSNEYSSKFSYEFDDEEQVISIQNAPSLSNLKNDFSLWGSKEVNGTTYPIHMRYAIDHKPVYYKNWDGTVYVANDSGLEGTQVDWRELIFQMAKDYRRHYHDYNFLKTIRDNNMKDEYESYYPKGFTGYEKYYIDFEMNLSQGVVAYWRELYNIEAAGQTGDYDSNGNFVVDSGDTWSANVEEYSKGTKVYYNGTLYKSLKNNNSAEPTTDTSWVECTGSFTYNNSGWNPDILDNPESLNFWFDFLDTTGELNKYSVSNIGLRSKATNDDKIKAIYFRETPNVIFQTEDDKVDQSNWRKSGYTYIRIPTGLDNLFNISSRGKNAMDVVEEYLYDYTYPVSSININITPVYHLTPNTLIYVNNKQTNTVGEYMLKGYSIQLGLSQSMTLTAVETPRRIY